MRLELVLGSRVSAWQYACCKAAIRKHFLREKITMRNVIISCITLLVSLALCAASIVAQQDKSKRPSPPAKAECKLPGGKTLTIDYSSPRANGRKIYGGLVPYGEVWRAGANEATTFVTDTNLNVGGTAVPAGSYTIFTLPSANQWKLIISKKTGEWGVPYPGQSSDFARIDMKVSQRSVSLANFTISFDQSGSGCTLHMDWETTQASVDIAAK